MRIRGDIKIIKESDFTSLKNAIINKSTFSGRTINIQLKNPKLKTAAEKTISISEDKLISAINSSNLTDTEKSILVGILPKAKSAYLKKKKLEILKDYKKEFIDSYNLKDEDFAIISEPNVEDVVFKVNNLPYGKSKLGKIFQINEKFQLLEKAHDNWIPFSIDEHKDPDKKTYRL